MSAGGGSYKDTIFHFFSTMGFLGMYKTACGRWVKTEPPDETGNGRGVGISGRFEEIWDVRPRAHFTDKDG